MAYKLIWSPAARDDLHDVAPVYNARGESAAIMINKLVEESDKVSIDIQSAVKDAENIDVAVRFY